MSKTKLFFSTVLFSTLVMHLGPSHVVAQSNGSAPETLEDYIHVALESHPGLKSSFETYRAAKRKARPAGQLPNPKLSYANFIRSVETRVGPQEHKVGLSQSLPWFGTLSLQTELAEKNAESLYYQFERRRLNLIKEVKQNYYQAYYLQRSIEILNQNVELMQRLERVTRSQYRTGMGDFSDVIRAQVELEKLKDLLASTKELKKPFLVKFNALLNRSPDHAFSWPQEIAEPKQEFSGEGREEELRSRNPALLDLRTQAEKEGLRIELAQKKGLPDFTLGFDYIFTGESIVPVSGSGKDPMVAMITLDIPIWRGSIGDQIEEARRNESAVRNAHEERYNQLVAMLAEAMYRRSDALRKIQLYRESLIPKSKQSFSATKRSYEAGKASFSDLIDSERLYLEFQLAFEDSWKKAKQAEAAIEAFLASNHQNIEKSDSPKEIEE